MSVRPIWIVAFLLGSAVIASSQVSCLDAKQFPASRVVTATVTLTNEQVIAVDSAVAVVVNGEARLDEILIELDATITASTSTRAELLAEMLAIVPEHVEAERTVKLNIAAPIDAGISGVLRLRVPSDLAVEIKARGGTADIDGVEGHIGVIAVSHVRVTAASNDIDIGVASGNALVETSLAAGSRTAIDVTAGDIELRVPEALSADIQATIEQRGQVVTAHPRLPESFARPGETYKANVGGGLSIVRLITGAGRIVIRTR